MRARIINILKLHPCLVRLFWKIMAFVLKIWGIFVPIKKKTMLFCSFGGRKFDDSPKAIYDEVCKRKEFADWELIWAFAEPEKFDIPRGRTVKIDTISFFKVLLYSHVWIGNSGITRGISLNRRKNIEVATWHGTPLKKIGGEENQNSLGGKKRKRKSKPDAKTIRCAQSEFDREIFARIFNAEKEAIILSDLPRNDALFYYTEKDVIEIKRKINIPDGKKVILYTPTYREYLINEKKETFLAPPINISKWEKKLGNEYVLLVRAHYAVSAALNIEENEFVKDVSNYDTLNDLYIISDMMISDYSSTYFDYSILNRPMLCFAYDLEEYTQKRGLYLELEETLPCPICKNEEEVIADILHMDYEQRSDLAEKFHKRFAPYAGNASKSVVDEISRRLI